MINDHRPSSLVVLASTQDHSQGVLSAAVVLVMYEDCQCPRSSTVYKLIKIIRQELTVAFREDYLCFIFRHFSQIQIHPQAQRAAQAAQAAAIQGKVWLMSDTLFNHQQRLENGYLVEYANDLEIDIPQFLKELSKQVHVDRINQNIEGGIEIGVTTAPALFINGIRYTERWKMTELMTAIVAVNH